MIAQCPGPARGTTVTQSAVIRLSLSSCTHTSKSPSLARLSGRPRGSHMKLEGEALVLTRVMGLTYYEANV